MSGIGAEDKRGRRGTSLENSDEAATCETASGVCWRLICDLASFVASESPSALRGGEEGGRPNIGGAYRQPFLAHADLKTGPFFFFSFFSFTYFSFQAVPAHLSLFRFRLCSALAASMALPSPSSSSEPLLARGDRTRDSWDDDAEALARDQDDDDVDVLHLDLADPDNDQPPPYNEKARSSKPPASPSSKRRRRYLIFATATVTAALVFTLFALLFFLPSDAESVAEVGSESTTYAPGSVEAEAEADHDVLAQNASTTTPPLYSPYVLGPPTDSFRGAFAFAARRS